MFLIVGILFFRARALRNSPRGAGRRTEINLNAISVAFCRYYRLHRQTVVKVASGVPALGSNENKLYLLTDVIRRTDGNARFPCRRTPDGRTK